MTKTMMASECKAKFLAVLDEVARTGEPVIVTKNGTPVCQIAPVINKPKTLFGAMKGYFEIKGDIVGPLDEAWDSERELQLIQGRLDELEEPPARYAHRRLAPGRKSKPRTKRTRDL